MKTDADHSQTLGGAQGILQMRRSKDCGRQRVQGHHQKTYRIANLVSKWLTETEPATREPAWHWPRHSAYSCLLVGLLTVGTGAFSDSSTGFWNPTPHIGSPCPILIQGGGVLSRTAMWYAMFCWYSWETCPFLNRNGGGLVWRWEQSRVGGGRDWEV